MLPLQPLKVISVFSFFLIPLISGPGVGLDNLPCSSLPLIECSPSSLSKTPASEAHSSKACCSTSLLLFPYQALPLISYTQLTVFSLPQHLSKSWMISVSVDNLNALAFQFLDLSSNKPSSLLPPIFICFTCPISWLSMAPKIGILIFLR